jgi:hypothetical protein
MTKFLRYLRIAFSATCLVLAALLCALWVRSYWWSDHYHVNPGTFIGGLTHHGRVVIHWFDGSNRTSAETGYHCVAIDSIMWSDQDRTDQPLYWYKLFTLSDGYALAVPIWFPATVIGVLAALPWLRFRFSLRTLLIATTLVAVGLGMIVWMSRAD